MPSSLGKGHSGEHGVANITSSTFSLAPLTFPMIATGIPDTNVLFIQLFDKSFNSILPVPSSRNILRFRTLGMVCNGKGATPAFENSLSSLPNWIELGLQMMP